MIIYFLSVTPFFIIYFTILNCTLYSLLRNSFKDRFPEQLTDQQLNEKIDEYINQTAYELAVNSSMPLPIQLSIKKFNSICEVRCYVKNDSGTSKITIPLESLPDVKEQILNQNNLIKNLINQFANLKKQSNFLLIAPLNRIIKELTLFKTGTDTDKFKTDIKKYKKQFYDKADQCMNIEKYLNSAEGKFLRASVKYDQYFKILRNEKKLIKTVWPELYNYMNKNEF